MSIPRLLQKTIQGRTEESPTSDRTRIVFVESNRHRAATCLALAALVFFSRAWLISAWGSPVPFWDQWGAEGPLYHGWLTGTWQWRDLIAPHNEHRIALTRLADLTLFVVSGGWNPWAQLFLNAALHAATAAAIAATFWTALPPQPRVVMLAGLAVIFTSTAGWQNALWGFQSQVYFASLFAVIAFAALARTGRSSLAVLALVLALFSNAGGLLAAGVAIVLAWPRARTLPAWLPFALALTVLTIGVALRVSAPHHVSLQAQTPGQFLAVFARGLSWPHVNSPWAWLVLQLPLVWLFARTFKRGSGVACTSADRFAFALAAFAVLQAAAVAYTRGAGLPELRPLSRYQDPLLLGAAAQLYAAVRLAVTRGRTGRWLLIGWCAVTAAGLISLTATHFSLNLPYKRAQDEKSLEQLQSYFQTSDVNVFAAGTSFSGPASDPAEVIRVLENPVLRPVLPPEFGGHTPRPWLLVNARVLTVGAIVLLAVMLVLSLSSRKGLQLNSPSDRT